MSEECFYFAVQMDVDPAKEDLFNEVYREEHMDFMLQVPGIEQVIRLEAIDDGPKYLALYRIADPSVLESPEYLVARDTGRWPDDVRPFTSNRSRRVYKVIDRRERSVAPDERKTGAP